MKEYVFVVNYQKENDYLYFDFLNTDGLEMWYAKYTKLRVRILKALSGLKLRDFVIVKKFFLNRIYHKDFLPRSVLSEGPVFIITGRVYELYGNSIIEYIKERYSESIVVLYILDMVYSMRFEIEEAKDIFDRVFSFDRWDCERYGLNHLLEPFSVGKLNNVVRNAQIKYDVSFVGHAKNRYHRIIAIYEALRKKGLKLDFHIVGVPKEKQKYREEIKYEPLSFDEIITHVAESKCVLEVVQEDEYSATTRFSEAVLLGKNLLSDAPVFREKKIDSSNIFWFDNPTNIPFEEITKQHNYDINKFEKMLSIQSFVNTIGKQLISEKGDK